MYSNAKQLFNPDKNEGSQYENMISVRYLGTNCSYCLSMLQLLNDHQLDALYTHPVLVWCQVKASDDMLLMLSYFKMASFRQNHN